MSIKHNIKRRMLMVVALAMTVAVLAAGTAHAQTSSPSQMSITQTPSAPEVVVGEPVTFHITLTNESPDDVSSNGSVYDVLPADAQFVSASPSQGYSTFEPTHLENGDVHFYTGPIPPGGTVQMEVVVVPQKAGSITNEVKAPMSSSEATVWVDAA
jgi:uncharacterized repeat protein (TIGR01451 family)